MSTTEIERVTCVRINEVLIEHLDEDWAEPCDVGRATGGPRGAGVCSNAAAWIAWSVRCCEARSVAVVLCDDHKAKLLANPFGVCQHCEHVFSPAAAGVRLIEPLNRRPQ